MARGEIRYRTQCDIHCNWRGCKTRIWRRFREDHERAIVLFKDELFILGWIFSARKLCWYCPEHTSVATDQGFQ